MVMTIPPGSSPGMTSFATAPTISPRTIITRTSVMGTSFGRSALGRRRWRRDPSFRTHRILAWGPWGSNGAGGTGAASLNRGRAIPSGHDRPRQHVAQREADEDAEPHEATRRGDLGQPARESNVHEVEDDEGRLEE